MKKYLPYLLIAVAAFILIRKMRGQSINPLRQTMPMNGGEAATAYTPDKKAITPNTELSVSLHRNIASNVVKDLQNLLWQAKNGGMIQRGPGVVDGLYGPQTSASHSEFIGYAGITSRSYAAASAALAALRQSNAGGASFSVMSVDHDGVLSYGQNYYAQE